MPQSVSPQTVPDCLLVFTRYPQAGQTKTRLIPALGAAGAASLQRQMTEHLLRQIQPFCLAQQINLKIHFAGGSRAQMLNWLGSDVSLISQCTGSLGQKLIFALTQAFTEGTTRAIVIGSDCPTLGNREIAQALGQLNSHDVVLGPAADGGYYLIALRAMHRCLFEDIPWGTDQVLAMTQAIAHRHHLSVAQLGILTDIDRPEDLPIWEAQGAVPTPDYRDAPDQSADNQS